MTLAQRALDYANTHPVKGKDFAFMFMRWVSNHDPIGRGVLSPNSHITFSFTDGSTLIVDIATGNLTIQQ